MRLAIRTTTAPRERRRMDFSNPSFWLTAGNYALTGVIAAAMWLRKPGSEAQEALKEHKEAVAKVDQRQDDAHRALVERVVVVETKLTNLPSKEDLAQVRGEVAALRGETSRNSQVLARIEQHLLNQKA